jgi:hypothetical protein
MPRTSPTDVDLSFCETHVAVRLELHDGTVYRMASATLNFIDEVDGQYNYVAHLMKDSDVKATLTTLADQANIAAQNVDRALGLTINDPSQTISNASVTLSKVFKQTGGTWDRKVLLQGVVAHVDVDENLCEIKIVSDVAPNVAFISTRSVQEKCPLIFKGRACGYVGALTTCNKIFDSQDGCAGRERQFRFGGAKDKGELDRPIRGGIDTTIGEGGGTTRFPEGGNRHYPDPINGRHAQVDFDLY